MANSELKQRELIAMAPAGILPKLVAYISLRKKNIVPHFIAVLIFLVVTVIFCKPALESGVVMKQSDIAGWQGMSHQLMDYKAAHGHLPLWITNMFSGMPAYQVAMEGNWSPLSFVYELMQLWLPKPMNYFFLACICFYFLCIVLRIRPYAAIIGTLGFTYCNFSPIMVTAGHDTQMMALAFAPGVMAGVVLLFDKKYWAGFGITALFTSLQIGCAHQQISYYLFIILFVMTSVHIGRRIRERQFGDLVKSLGLLVIAGLIGVAVNAISLFPTYDYSKSSKRGGQLVMNADQKKGQKTENGKTTGLSQEYAFQWSYGKAETMSLLFPGVKGYGLHYAERNGEPYLFPSVGEDAHSVSYLTGLFPNAPAEQIAPQMSQSLYWGDQPGTNGPVYLGAVICFLFMLGMFILDDKHKWWILGTSVFAVLLAWGYNFEAFNSFMFDHLPFYNKFRAPTMALVIPQLLFPIIASLTINKLWDKNVPDVMKKFKYAVMTTAAVFALAVAMYATSDFGNENRMRTKAFNEMLSGPQSGMQQKYNEINTKEEFDSKPDNRFYENWVLQMQGNPDGQKVSATLLSELRKDRASVFLHDILMSLLFVLLAGGLILLYLREKIGTAIMVAGVTLVSLIDLMIIDTKYLNDKSFDSKDSYEAAEFPMSDADRTILADKDPNFRVYNESVGSPFEESKTSYYHKSIGGYHPAKLGIYDDLSTYQLPRGNPNPQVLNMLNAKYIIVNEQNKLVAERNPEALGNAWFVKGISFVKGPTEEMKALYTLNTKDSAVADESFKSMVTPFSPADSSATIKMTAFDNDAIAYESNSSSNNLAVFSEVWYKDWKAYIDDKPAQYIKVNYVLRAMVIPAGKHKIDFKYEPKIFFMSKTISTVATYIMFLLLIAAVVAAYIKKKPEEKA